MFKFYFVPTIQNTIAEEAHSHPVCEGFLNYVTGGYIKVII